MATLIHLPPARTPRLLAREEPWRIGRFYVNASNVFLHPVQRLDAGYVVVERAYRHNWWIDFERLSSLDATQCPEWHDHYCYRETNLKSWLATWEITAVEFRNAVLRKGPPPKHHPNIRKSR